MDQRCHGQSTRLDGFSPPHTLGRSATDIAQVRANASMMLHLTLVFVAQGWSAMPSRTMSQACLKPTRANRLGLSQQRQGGVDYILSWFASCGTMKVVQFMRRHLFALQLFRGRFDGAGPDMLIGHSLGGKVLLNYLSQGATGLLLPKQVSAVAP